MIIDTHCHIWHVPPIAPVGPTAPRWRKLPDEPAPAEELLEDMDANGVDMTVVVQTSWSTWDNGYVADSAKRFPDRFIAMGMIDPEDPKNAELARYWMQERGVAGFRFHPAYYPEEPILTVERNAPMWKAIADMGGIVQVHGRIDMAPQVDFVAREYPTIPWLLDHMAYPVIPEYPDFPTYQPILDLAKHPNVYVKVSDIKSRSTMPYPYEDVQGAIKKLYDAFGIERMMWGTGYPGHHRTKHKWPTLGEELQFIRDIPWLTEAEKARVLGGTAQQVWGR